MLEDELISKHMKTIVEVGAEECFYTNLLSVDPFGTTLLIGTKIFSVKSYELIQLFEICFFFFQMENSGVVHMLKNNKTEGIIHYKN